VLAQLEHGRTYCRKYCRGDSYGHTVGTQALVGAAGHMFRRTPLPHGSCDHNAGTSWKAPPADAFQSTTTDYISQGTQKVTIEAFV